MTRSKVGVAIKLPAILAAAAGIMAVGLLTTPIASAEPPTDGSCPAGEFPATDGSGCAGIPDPVDYGCPPGDYDCMFRSGPGPH